LSVFPSFFSLSFIHCFSTCGRWHVHDTCFTRSLLSLLNPCVNVTEAALNATRKLLLKLMAPRLNPVCISGSSGVNLLDVVWRYAKGSDILQTEAINRSKFWNEDARVFKHARLEVCFLLTDCLTWGPTLYFPPGTPPFPFCPNMIDAPG